MNFWLQHSHYANYLLVAHTSEVTQANKIALDPAHPFILCGVVFFMLNEGHEILMCMWDIAFF